MKKTVLTVFLLLLLVAIPALAADQRGVAIRPVAPTGGEAKGDLWLLAIGIDSYLYWPRLKTATNDAKAVRNTLLSRYHLDKTHVIELLDDKATRKNILAAFRDLAKPGRVGMASSCPRGTMQQSATWMESATKIGGQ